MIAKHSSIIRQAALYSILALHLSAQPRWTIAAIGPRGTATLTPAKCAKPDAFKPTPNTGLQEAKATEVGTIEGFRIVELQHHIASNDLSQDHKTILVERSPGTYCQIYQRTLDSDGRAIFEPASILTDSGRQILEAKLWTGGNGDMIEEEYWVFDRKGPTRLDLSPISNALMSVLPANTEIRKHYTDGIETMCLATPVWKKDDGTQPTGGIARIKMTITGNSLRVTSKQYLPNETQATCP